MQCNIYIMYMLPLFGKTIKFLLLSYSFGCVRQFWISLKSSCTTVILFIVFIFLRCWRSHPGPCPCSAAPLPHSLSPVSTPFHLIQAGLELEIFLFQSPEFWDYRSVPPSGIVSVLLDATLNPSLCFVCSVTWDQL